MPIAALLICEEHHRRIRRHRSLAGAGGAPGASTLPRSFQLRINSGLSAVGLDPINFLVPLPGQQPFQEESELSHSGDARCSACVLLDLPGAAYTGPLSLSTMEHRIAYAAAGMPVRCALLCVTACFTFHDAVDWVELQTNEPRRAHTIAPVSRTSALALLQEEGIGRDVEQVELNAFTRGLATPKGAETLSRWLEMRGHTIPDKGIIFQCFCTSCFARLVGARFVGRHRIRSATTSRNLQQCVAVYSRLRFRRDGPGGVRHADGGF
jgi:hypothetical protein